MELAIRGGTIVSGQGQRSADLGVSDGKIVQLGGIVPGATRELDARECLVLPGCVDLHTHLLGAPRFQPLDDFTSGGRAAAAGGVTTVGDFTHQLAGETLTPALERALSGARGAVVDYVFHVVLNDPTPAAIADIPTIAAAGHMSLKIFMVSEAFASRRAEYLRALRAAGRAGVLTLVHAEDHGIVAFRTAELLAAGKRGVEWFPESRPPIAEEIAVREAVSYAVVAEAPILLVHLSSRRALDALRAGRVAHNNIHAELRPIYLYLTRDVFSLPNNEGAKYVGQPPLRESADVDAMWSALAAGDFSTMGTDHFPHLSASKLAAGLDFSTVPPGVSNLETMLPMLYSEGVRNGRITMERVVQVLAEQPAKLAGIAPRKGSLTVGADADIVIFDPRLVRTINSREMQSKADYDPFEGREVTGWPRYTLSRGEVVYENGNVIGAAGRGQLVPRAAFRGVSAAGV